MKAENYAKYSISKLIQIAQKHFNEYIRLRDAGKSCISCGSHAVLEACHYYSAGNYSGLRFNSMNVHGGCKKCNCFLHGNLIEYRQGLINRYGEKYVKDLEIQAGIYKRTPMKWDKFELIAIIKECKQDIKLLKK